MGQTFLFFDSPWIAVAIFAIFQVYFFVSSITKLAKLKSFFLNLQKLDIEKSTAGYTLHIDGSSRYFGELIKEINEYLEKNEGTTDFGIIKDKVESRLEALYEDASSKVSFPTYLGLMGTFAGVFIGLLSFRRGIEVSGITDDVVSALIGGIIVSMVTSLIGLLLMIFGNIKAANVLKKVNDDKTKFFDFIQVKLLPVLGTSMVSALNKLHGTINTFEPAFKGVIREFKSAFSECTVTLRETFGEKVQLLTSAVDTMGSNMSLINENVEMQKQLIKTMRQRETLKTLDSFVAAADKFDGVTSSIAALSDVKDNLADSSVRLVEAQKKFIDQMSIPERVFEKINAILNRIVTFEESLNALGESIAKTQLLGNSQMNLIQEQLTAIKKKTDLAVSYQELADDELKEFYKAYKSEIKKLNDSFCTEIEEHGRNFASSMKDFKSAYEKVMSECKVAVEAKRNQFVDEINRSLDLEAKNQYLSQLANIPQLLSMLSNIQSSVKVQPEVSAKITNVLNQIEEIKSSLDATNPKGMTDVDKTEISKQHPKKSSWPFSMFGRKG